MKKAISFGQGMDLWKEEEQIDKFIQSRQQPKEIEVEIEMETKKQLVNGYKNQPDNVIGFVADPSFPKAFVNGILESKQWVVAENGKYEEVYEKFEKSLRSLPKKNVDAFLREHILKFIKSI
jgi:hypothetical protein